MARYNDEEIRQLKRNISIVELCRSRGIELKPHGRKDLIGACPFHKENEPSFVVSPDKNLFHCLGCDAAGSVIDLVMKLDGIEFRDAVDKLLGSTGHIRRASASHSAIENRKSEIEPERANQLLERVVSIYEKNLSESPEGKSYLAYRGIEDMGLLTQHRVGYCNGRLTEILPSPSNGDATIRSELMELGIFLDSGKERFTGCLVFPVCDVDGNLVTLYGRYTNDGRKRHLFMPDRPTGLWNVAAIKTYPDIILVESVLDALSVMVAGHPNVISIQGTNGLKGTDLDVFKEHAVRSITLLLDGDESGQKSSKQLNEKISSCFSCHALALPDDHDPNTYLQEHGAEKLHTFLSSESSSAKATEDRPEGSKDTTRARCPASPSSSPVLTIGRRSYEVHGLEKGSRKLKATVRVEHAGRLHVDTLDLYSARSRRTLAQDLCRIFDESPDTIEADISKLLKHCEDLPQLDGGTRTPDTRPSLTDAERSEAEAFGQSPDLINMIMQDFEACGLVGEKANKLLGYLAMTSRKMDEPLSVLILSSSGAGKTALQDTALGFCPPEDLVKLTSLSGKALFYKEQMSLKHKVLALEEGAGAEEASYAIRNLITAGELIIESAIKDNTTGRITTMENRVEGPTSVFVTTTDPATDPETRSRFFVTSIDESREQTRAILGFQRKRQTLEGLNDRAKDEKILAKHRNFQRLLKPLAVINPYAGQLTYGDDRLQGRRDQPKYLSLINAVAFLRQMAKPVKSFGNNGSSFEYIEVDLDDITIANELADEILGKSLDELSRPGRDLLLELERMGKKKTENEEERTPPVTFTRRDVRTFTGWSNYRVHTHLKELVEFEYVLAESGRNGSLYRYRLAYEGQGKNGERFMLGLRNVQELQKSGS